MPDQTLSTEQVADRIGLARASFCNIRKYLPTFPVPTQIDKKNRYDQAAIEKWLTEHDAKKEIKVAYCKLIKGEIAIELQINRMAKAFLSSRCERIKSTSPPLQEKYKNYRKTVQINADF